ncbi:MAG: YggS family pyridoxal phosphate-dependent enzyme [Ezakiella sp.]|uniref:YggS family pyridoxal phosphate-dependent enzyme n=1 Tax=Ezakiella sp. TaxID=1935205 RepID=UPI0029775486|nr:YggS family pyridoxal phosphate-dependent enzyme [Ezakiella sp.]MDD7731009.1 YggS family pyridoxal phosphate-dependent enzyme [Eubacteriales bacterium]MDY6079538.1 YggS family pyridoxal phosphate-dependent enzyme [Ezakiella sp.]
MTIKDNVNEVRENMAKAALRAGRNPEDITLCAVSKYIEVPKIKEALEAGVTVLGENKVQELVDKLPQFSEDVNFHMIGQLQTNKVKYIIDKVKLIHSLDRKSLLKTLDKEAKKKNIISDTLIQVNLTSDPNRGGVSIEELPEFVEEVGKYSSVRVRGLMCVAQNVDDENIIREDFRRMRLEFERLKLYNISNVSGEILSMGMSHDYEIAIEEGATLVRVGTRIFGKR